MMESDEKEEKHPTKAVTSEPQEEFIAPDAQPTRSETEIKPTSPPADQDR
jgi:hypothetical protein